jgi:hypothetical protein
MADVFFHVLPGVNQGEVENAFGAVIGTEVVSPPRRLYPDAEPGTSDARAFYARVSPNAQASEALDRIQAMDVVERACLPARRGF